MTTFYRAKHFDFYVKIWYNEKIMKTTPLDASLEKIHHIVDLVESVKMQKKEILSLQNTLRNGQKELEQNDQKRNKLIAEQELLRQFL